MYFLAIETTGAFASVALLEDDRVLEHIQGHDRFSHLQKSHAAGERSSRKS